MTDENITTFHKLKLPGMAKSWQAMAETHQLDKLTVREGIPLMLQAELDTRSDNRIARLIHNAHFRQRASMTQVEPEATRGLPADRLSDLATCDYIKAAMSVLITGPAGVGKTFLASAMGNQACQQGYKVLYFTMNMLIENLQLAALEGRQTNFFRKLAAHDLLIIDDFGMRALDGTLQNDFEQIIDDRYATTSLILCSQLPVSDWYCVFKSELIAEACLDRLVHRSIRFELKGESLRKKY